MDMMALVNMMKAGRPQSNPLISDAPVFAPWEGNGGMQMPQMPAMNVNLQSNWDVKGLLEGLEGLGKRFQAPQQALADIMKQMYQPVQMPPPLQIPAAPAITINNPAPPVPKPVQVKPQPAQPQQQQQQQAQPQQPWPATPAYYSPQTPLGVSGMNHGGGVPGYGATTNVAIGANGQAVPNHAIGAFGQAVPTRPVF